jgi:hypothetical protein
MKSCIDLFFLALIVLLCASKIVTDQSLVLTRFLYANRYPLRLKTLLALTHFSS